MLGSTLYIFISAVLAVIECFPLRPVVSSRKSPFDFSSFEQISKDRHPRTRPSSAVQGTIDDEASSGSSASGGPKSRALFWETGSNDSTWVLEANSIEYVVGNGNSEEDGLSSSFGSLAQLGLNISDSLTSRAIIPIHLVGASDLFCNRELNMDQIEAIGFDMDYTLAQYNTAFDLLAYEGAKQKLVSWLGYPAEVLDLQYDNTMCRRGCIIDKRRGNIIKLDRHKYVRLAAHGLSPLSDSTRKTLYRDRFDEMNAFSGPNFVIVDTPFSLVDGCLYAQLVDLMDKLSIGISDGPGQGQGQGQGQGKDQGQSRIAKSYEAIWKDMRKCVDRCHKDGVIKDTVAQDPQKYIIYDSNIFPMLQSFRASGKKVFLLTNSLWEYTMVAMNYLEGRKTGDRKDYRWMEAFDVVIVGGNKPAFLVDERSLPLFRIDKQSGSLENVDEVPSDAKEVDRLLERGKLFQGGNAQLLHRLLQLSSGDRLLYVGDHMYADVLRSKRTLGWRTCLVVPELTKEIIAHKQSSSIQRELQLLRREQYLKQLQLDDFTDSGETETEADAEAEAGEMSREREPKPKVVPEASKERSLVEVEMRTELEKLRGRIKQLLAQRDSIFHNKWGPLFKAGIQESRFAKQVTDYACLYTSKASNLGLQSPERPFRPVRDKMPHDHFLEEL